MSNPYKNTIGAFVMLVIVLFMVFHYTFVAIGGLVR